MSDLLLLGAMPAESRGAMNLGGRNLQELGASELLCNLGSWESESGGTQSLSVYQP